MTSPTPLEYGEYYHIFGRGNNREKIFFEERNYPYFLSLYGRYIVPVADTYAYCLLRNHFHRLYRCRAVVQPTRRTAGIPGHKTAAQRPSDCAPAGIDRSSQRLVPQGVMPPDA